MSVIKVLSTAFAVTLFLSMPSLALTVTNKDSQAHKLTVAQKKDDVVGETKEVEVAAGESMELKCEGEECAVTLAGSENAVDANDDDKLVIKDGALKLEE